MTTHFGPVHRDLVGEPAVSGEDRLALDRLTREHPEHTADLSEIFEVATAAERSEHLDDDQMDTLCRPRDVLTPAHGFSERTERGVVLALVITVALLFVLATFIDTPTVDTFPRYTTDREVPVR
ncbi:hypothetical protein [Ornithinimicrobium murale]|uniref:hypothetical protein n=1 Tax=Ornithinimicrobium murale TaxID=1050153 RepID=UPI000E0DB4F6|nr:hypothetical protein [Ornithinimicrobium murale]